MQRIQVVFLGTKESGKTQLMNLLFKDEQLLEEYTPTQRSDYWIKTITKTSLDLEKKFEIWDLPGRESLKNAFSKYEHSISLYCIDLSKEINIESIQETINSFKTLYPNSKLVVVGTKYDQCSCQPQTIFSELKKIQQFFITSAKTQEGLPLLFDYLSQSNNSFWHEEVEKLSQAMENLPKEKRQQIHKELKLLFGFLQTKIYNASEQIEHFVQRCNAILEGKHPIIKNTITSIAIMALMTSICGLIGFGVGFGGGLWTGPGAFLSGIMVGTKAAMGVCLTSSSIGAFGGLIAAQGLFKPSKEKKATIDFAKTIANYTPPSTVEF